MMVGQLDMTAMLAPVEPIKITAPVYLEANFDHDTQWLTQLKHNLFDNQPEYLSLPPTVLNNCNKTIAGQLAIDIERTLNYQVSDATIAAHPAMYRLSNGRVVLKSNTLSLHTYGSAGQSYGAFLNTGMQLQHTGTHTDHESCFTRKTTINQQCTDRQLCIVWGNRWRIVYCRPSRRPLWCTQLRCRCCGRRCW